MWSLLPFACIIAFAWSVASQTTTYCPTNQKCSAYCYLRQSKFYTTNAYPQTLTLTPVFTNIPQGASVSAEWTVYDSTGARQPKTVQNPPSTYSLTATSSSPYFVTISLKDTTFNFLYCSITAEVASVSTAYALTTLPVFNSPSMAASTSYVLDTTNYIKVNSPGLSGTICGKSYTTSGNSGVWIQLKLCPDATDYKSYSSSISISFKMTDSNSNTLTLSVPTITTSGLPVSCQRIQCYGYYTAWGCNSGQMNLECDNIAGTSLASVSGAVGQTQQASWSFLISDSGTNVTTSSPVVTVESVQPYGAPPCTDTTLGACALPTSWSCPVAC